MATTWRSAPAVKAALSEATRRYPRRNRKHDGTVGDLAHSNRTSDHNPDGRGVVLAFDLTHDPGAGCDAHALVRAAVARRDPRIKYAISRRQIWSKALAHLGWRPYSGSNRHDLHAHVSVDPAHENDTSAWWPPPAPPPPTVQEDDDMSPDQERLLTEAHRMLTALGEKRLPDKTDRDPARVDLGDVLTRIDELPERIAAAVERAIGKATT